MKTQEWRKDHSAFEVQEGATDRNSAKELSACDYKPESLIKVG